MDEPNIINVPPSSLEFCGNCGRLKGNCDHYPPVAYRQVVTKSELAKLHPQDKGSDNG